ncbi:ricin-type beta-trefoil lectin domain protein [Streptomyces microflavus]|uniref:ricin-type beta-trefoil lectin domain protein n=1 Tax=Streptomyces microflavus TaxID=1919 RepID=UPI0033A25C6A
MFRKWALTVATAGSVSAAMLAGPHFVADAATAPRHTTVPRAEGKAAAPQEFTALKNKDANECLDANAMFRMYSCNGARVQQWGFADAGEGKVFLVWKENNKCATTNFYFVDCNNNNAAKYTLEKVHQTYEFLKIRDNTDGKCLGAEYTPELGWGLTAQSCSNGDSRLWIKQ